MRSLHRNNKGFGVAGIALVVLVVGLIGFTGWAVWNRQQKNTSSVQRQTAAVDSFDSCLAAGGAVLYSDPPVCEKDGQRFTQTKSQGVAEVALEAGYTPPAGWKVEESSNNAVRLRGSKNNCFVDAVVLKTADAKKAEAAKFTANQFQRVLAGPVDKPEYKITKLDSTDRGSTLKVDGGDGAETYDTLEVRVTGRGKTMRQTHAYIVGDGKYGYIQASCDGDDYTGTLMGDERGDDSQVIFGDIMSALHFKVL